MKNITYTLFTLLISILFFCSCAKNKEVETVVKNFINKQVILPNDSLINNYSQKYSNPLTKKIKILTFIDGDCSICYDELELWEEEMKKIDTSKVGVIFCIYTYDNLTQYDNSSLKFPYPYFKDVRQTILKKNQINSENKHYKTFLLGEMNKVILIGNPILNEKISNLYMKEIKNRI